MQAYLGQEELVEAHLSPCVNGLVVALPRLKSHSIFVLLHWSCNSMVMRGATHVVCLGQE